jgi:hypothetical protein
LLRSHRKATQKLVERVVIRGSGNNGGRRWRYLTKQDFEVEKLNTTWNRRFPA